MADESPPSITPVPLPPAAKNVVLFGGTFDPPHLGHVRVPLQVLNRAMPADTFLLYVPAAKSPLKDNAPEASDADRLEMLQLCLIELNVDNRVAIWTDELDRARASPGPSYTIDTVRRLREALNPAVNIRLLIGADQALGFHRWRSAAELLKEAPPLVMLRDPIRTRKLFELALEQSGQQTRADVEQWLDRVVDTGFIDISSSGVRRLLHEAHRAGGEPGASIQAALGEGVLNFIEEHGLYR